MLVGDPLTPGYPATGCSIFNQVSIKYLLRKTMLQCIHIVVISTIDYIEIVK